MIDICNLSPLHSVYTDYSVIILNIVALYAILALFFAIIAGLARGAEVCCACIVCSILLFLITFIILNIGPFALMLLCITWPAILIASGIITVAMCVICIAIA